MSAWYWLLWLIFTVLNAALLYAHLRVLRNTAALFAQLDRPDR